MRVYAFVCSLLQMLLLLKETCLFRILPQPVNTNILRSRHLALVPVCYARVRLCLWVLYIGAIVKL
jgi:hypothetical protein